MSANFLNQRNWDNVTDDGRNNIVFQNRNHHYGAYVIRRDYNNTLLYALFIGIGFFLSVALIPKMILSNQGIEKVKIPDIIQIIPMDVTPPDIKIKDVDIAIVDPPPAKKIKVLAQQNNVAPVVVDKKTDDQLAANISIINPGTTTTTGETGVKADTKSNTGGTLIVESAPSGPVISAEIMPEFPGGETALFKYLQNNINYPAGAREAGIKGTVIIGFVIDVTGKPVMLTILKGIRGGKDLEMEAMRVIASMPNWSIGKQNNQAVPVQFSIPVKFTLN